ncbi:MAG: multicopper oxidase domain-containing protein [Acidobacteriota bacterium]
MSKNRRDFLCGSALTAVGVLSGTTAVARTGTTLADSTVPGRAGGAPATAAAARAAATSTHLPLQTLDLPTLDYELEGDVKVFHLTAEVVRREFLPGRAFDVWGYNGTMPGPTIEVNQGDRVRLVVENHLPEPTSMHWHGFEVPAEMDGVPGVSQDPIPMGMMTLVRVLPPELYEEVRQLQAAVQDGSGAPKLARRQPLRRPQPEERRS